MYICRQIRFIELGSVITGIASIRGMNQVRGFDLKIFFRNCFLKFQTCFGDGEYCEFSLQSMDTVLQVLNLGGEPLGRFVFVKFSPVNMHDYFGIH